MSRVSYVSLSTYFSKKIYHQSASRAYTGPLSETIPSSCTEVMNSCQRVNSVVEPLVEKASDECSSSAKDKDKSMRSIKFP